MKTRFFVVATAILLTSVVLFEKPLKNLLLKTNLLDLYACYIRDIENFVAKLQNYGFKFWKIKSGGTLEKITEKDLLNGEPIDIVACANNIEA